MVQYITRAHMHLREGACDCPCGITNISEYHFIQHFKTHHIVQLYQCIVCALITHTILSMEMHMRNH